MSSFCTAQVRLYDLLFCGEDPGNAGDNWLDDLNPASLKVVSGAYASPALSAAKTGDRFQFERLGYFVVDQDSSPSVGLVVNRTVTLKESAFTKAAVPAGKK